MKLISTSRRLCIPEYKPHKWKDAPQFVDDWEGVIKAEKCSRCGLIKQTCHGPSYKYYCLIESTLMWMKKGD